MIHNPSVCKLGRKPAVIPAGVMRMASLVSALPKPPVNAGWTGSERFTWDMDGNDTVGDCAFADAAHFQQLISTVAGSPEVPTAQQVIAEYSRLTGYDPADPSTDQGTVLSDLWKAWADGGLFGTKIDGYVLLNGASPTEIRDAVWFFGACHLGLALPVSAQNQVIWDVVPSGIRGDGAPGSWGGHAVPIVDCDSLGVVVLTWGSTKRATWQFLATYVEEAWAILHPLWIEKSGKDPGGVPLASLRADLQRIQHS